MIIFSWVRSSTSLSCKLILLRLSFETKQKWQEWFELDDLYVRQNDNASGQSEIMTEIREKNQNISFYKAKSIPLSNFIIGFKSIFNEL